MCSAEDLVDAVVSPGSLVRYRVPLEHTERRRVRRSTKACLALGERFLREFTAGDVEIDAKDAVRPTTDRASAACCPPVSDRLAPALASAASGCVSLSWAEGCGSAPPGRGERNCMPCCRRTRLIDQSCRSTMSASVRTASSDVPPMPRARRPREVRRAHWFSFSTCAGHPKGWPAQSAARPALGAGSGPPADSTPPTCRYRCCSWQWPGNSN